MWVLSVNHLIVSLTPFCYSYSFWRWCLCLLRAADALFSASIALFVPTSNAIGIGSLCLDILLLSAACCRCSSCSLCGFYCSFSVSMWRSQNSVEASFGCSLGLHGLICLILWSLWLELLQGLLLSVIETKYVVWGAVVGTASVRMRLFFLSEIHWFLPLPVLLASKFAEQGTLYLLAI